MDRQMLNAALAPMAQTIFPQLCAIEQNGGLPPSLLADAATVEVALSPARLSLLPPMFGAERSVGDALQARFEALQFSPERIDDLVGQMGEAIAEGTVAVPANYSGEALALELSAITYVIASYGLGQPVRCPHTDGPVFEAGSWQYVDAAAAALEIADQAAQSGESVFAASLRTALALLDVNDFRGHFALEPTIEGINKAAKAAAASTDWSHHPYSAIVIPGFGPFDSGLAVSPRGRLQVQLAAKHFELGLAPFIVVSGGRVWPARTRYRESEQMRTALIEDFGIDPAALIVEPYARHTPANLRNATRQLVSVGVPLDKDVLVVTNNDQLDHMMSEIFGMRCMQELGHLPGAFGARVSAVAAAFRPSLEALKRNPMDPLDP
ncbi:YdcF family protein [Sphingomonas sp.]|uniref:YdcF family protein n=1 Tax=Sphingomonas sp. TaxID=28214 RepID=UPI0025F3AB42|nr:YdcF family protein [Sphingomonas sp.]